MHRSFEFSAGSAALNLVDTIGGRGVDEVELLSTPDDLTTWLARIGAPISPNAVSTADLSTMRSLREAIFKCASAAIATMPLPSRYVTSINAFAALPAFRPQLLDGSVSFVAEDPLVAAVSFLAADAVEILSQPYRTRLRACPDCKMLFLDRSGPGRRRWCSSSSRCGNRAKVRNFRSRKAQQEAGNE